MNNNNSIIISSTEIEFDIDDADRNEALECFCLVTRAGSSYVQIGSLTQLPLVDLSENK